MIMACIICDDGVNVASTGAESAPVLGQDGRPTPWPRRPATGVDDGRPAPARDARRPAWVGRPTWDGGHANGGHADGGRATRDGSRAATWDGAPAGADGWLWWATAPRRWAAGRRRRRLRGSEKIRPLLSARGRRGCHRSCESRGARVGGNRVPPRVRCLSVEPCRCGKGTELREPTLMQVYRVHN